MVHPDKEIRSQNGNHFKEPNLSPTKPIKQSPKTSPVKKPRSSPIKSPGPKEKQADESGAHNMLSAIPLFQRIARAYRADGEVDGMAGKEPSSATDGTVAPRTAAVVVKVVFRYFPPAVLARWTVDVGLAISSTTLALVRDFTGFSVKIEEEPKRADIKVVFSQFVSVEGEKDINIQDDGDRNKRNVKDLDDPEKILEIIPPSKMIDNTGDDGKGAMMTGNADHVRYDSFLGSSDSATDESDEEFEHSDDDLQSEALMVDLQIAFGIPQRLACWLLLRILMITTLALHKTSDYLHSLAGLDDVSTPAERNEWRRIFAGLLSPLYVHGDNKDKKKTFKWFRNVKKEWMFDVVVDKHVRSLRKCYVFGRLLDAMDVYHPLKIAEKTTTRIRAARRGNAGLVKYLQEDPDYDENQDSDYLPSDEEIPMDPLAHEERDVDPVNETDNDVHSRKPAGMTLQDNTGTGISSDGDPQKGSTLATLNQQVEKYIFPRAVMAPVSPLLSPVTRGKSDRQSFHNTLETREGHGETQAHKANGVDDVEDEENAISRAIPHGPGFVNNAVNGSKTDMSENPDRMTPIVAEGSTDQDKVDDLNISFQNISKKCKPNENNMAMNGAAAIFSQEERSFEPDRNEKVNSNTSSINHLNDNCDGSSDLNISSQLEVHISDCREPGAVSSESHSAGEADGQTLSVEDGGKASSNVDTGQVAHGW